MRTARMFAVAVLLLAGAAAPAGASPAAARQPVWHEGTTMALLRGWVGDDDEWHYQIWRTEPVPGQQGLHGAVQLTADPDLLPHDAELSHTADQVAFTAGSGGTATQHALDVMNIDGSGRRNLLAGDGLVSAAHAPSWSPDDQHLVFQGTASTAGNFSHEIWTIDATGRNLRQVTHCDCALWNTPQWSPTRNEVLWSPDIYDLAILDLDTGRSTELYDDAPSGAMHVMEYHWSPDGDRVVFTANAWNDVEPDVYTINRDGSLLTRVAAMDGVSFENPMYSPDGSLVAVNAVRQDSAGDLIGDIWWFDPQQGLAAWHTEMGVGPDDRLASWQHGPTGPTDPGGDWSEITVQHTEASGYVYLTGGLMPGRPGTTVVAVLQRQVTKRHQHVWKTLRSTSVPTTDLSTYAAALARGSGGLCRVTVAWAGDATARPARRTTNTFGC